MNWIDKYKPSKVSELVGNGPAIYKILLWLDDFETNKTINDGTIIVFKLPFLILYQIFLVLFFTVFSSESNLFSSILTITPCICSATLTSASPRVL